jgi:hypothetical protein
VLSRRNASPPSGDETELLFDVLLEAGLTGSIPVIGDEMRPTLEPDDRVIVTPFLGLPSPGQMVMARHQGRVVARRLAEVRMIGGRRHYCLRADTGPAGTIEVLREELIGRPTAILRRGVLRSLDDNPSRRSPAPRRLPGTRRRHR